ncbi:MAG TPA: tetratricopeptide repeat protein [Blastocatellia bacterium]|nr:tetratricopeptide repeat protein [Blastocatellia bacterium]
MWSPRIFSRSSFLPLALIITFAVTKAPAQTAQLGRIEFPTSGSPAAQEHFLRGVAAMHSFWYEEALEAFQAATKADPTFAMGYWGEAMTYNHPVWQQQDAEAARRALSNIVITGKVTAREKAWIEAARVLYGEGDKLARDFTYAAAMEKIYHDNPDDLEAAAFYSLALLGTVRQGDKGFQRQMKAGAIALEVYQKNPNHPGAAHYIIHSFDDPEHAILALPAARRYAEIAPAAHHARHMPAHIFLQLGMWPEAAASNESAWAVSDEWVKRKNLALNLRDYHSYHWLTYVYVQQGRYGRAEELINNLRRTAQENGRDSIRLYDEPVAAYIVDTQRWELAAKLFELPKGKAPSASAGQVKGDEAAHNQHGATPQSTYAQPSATTVPSSRRGPFLPLFVRALAATQGALPEADKLLAEMRELRQQNRDAYGAKMMEIRELEVAALLSAAKNNYDEAVAMMKKATALEEEMSPPSGPPTLIKPSHELFGEILLRAGRPKEAAVQFATSLQRQPNRARSLLGAARSAAQSGDKAKATAAYTDFLRVWQQADAQLPELREAREFLGQASLR